MNATVPQPDPTPPIHPVARGELEEGIVRPTGFLQPTHERAVRAVKALEDGRLKDMECNIDAIPESPPTLRAWKFVLKGLLMLERSDFTGAEALLRQAAGPELLDHADDGPDAERPIRVPTGDARLASAAAEKLGFIYRRQDRPDEAYRTHLAAFRLRQQYGSTEEQWETAVSLGIDADLGRRYTDAKRWHRLAIDLGEKSLQEPNQKQGVACTNLAASLLETGDYEQAVSMARTARERWREHDLGAATADLADMRLGHALLRQAESLFERDPKQTGSALLEALDLFAAANAALLAFGSAYAADVQWCLEQTDFARRLQDTLDT